VEARELVEQATSDFLALERTPSDRESLDSAFRAFHTLKGGSGIVDFDAMGRAAHAAEDVLSAVRAGERPITAGLVGDCLSCLDRIVQWLDTIEDSGVLPQNAERDAERIVTRFSAASVSTIAEAASPFAVAASPLAILKNQLSLVTDDGPGAQGRMASAGRLAVNVLRHLERFEESERIAHSLLESGAQIDPLALAWAIKRAVEQLDETMQSDEMEPAANRSDPLSRNLRVDAKHVNALVNLAAELTVAKNAVGHLARLAQEGRNALASQIKGEHERLDRLVSALQLAGAGTQSLAASQCLPEIFAGRARNVDFVDEARTPVDRGRGHGSR
jgi:two-component system chemotaxis sensor kinase CheA